MPNENHDPKTGEFASGHGGSPDHAAVPYHAGPTKAWLAARTARNKAEADHQHGANHGEPIQHPLASADAHAIHANLGPAAMWGPPSAGSDRLAAGADRQSTAAKFFHAASSAPRAGY